MTSATPWLGTKRIAFVPLYRSFSAPPDQIPDQWESKIRTRTLYDPQPAFGGADRSLRAWVRAASSGRADLDPIVFPMETIDRPNVEADDLDGRLGDRIRGMGCHGAVLVMLGQAPSGTNRGFWSRVVMAEGNGVWLMEILHGLTNFKDLYHFGNDTDPADRAIGTFDEMSASSATHPTVFTKQEFGWLDASSIARHDGASTRYDLQHVGLAQPPVGGTISAVRIGDTVPYVIVESRRMVDQFEAGIAGQGVIAYRVQTANPTVQARPDGKKPLYLMTQVPLQPGQTATLDDGVTLTVSAATEAGATVVVDDPGRHLLDRTAATGARGAASSPCALVLDAKAIENLAFRGGDGHLHEIWRAADGSGTTDLTANAGAPSSASRPWTYFDPSGDQVVLIFRSDDDRVRSLYWMYGAVGHDDLTGAIGAPGARGNPAGWFTTSDGFHHVAYADDDGHLHELWWQGQGGVGHGDLTAAIGATAAAGDPFPYYDAVHDVNVVAFRGTDGRIRSLYWGPALALGQDDLSGTAGTPNASDDPFAYYHAVDDTSHVVYRAGNGHLYELRWVGIAPVSGRDLTALSGAPAAAPGRVSGGYNAGDNTHHVMFRSDDGRLHELWHFVGEEAVHHADLTAAYGAPAAGDQPVYYATVSVPNQHVAYRGTDDHVYELRW